MSKATIYLSEDTAILKRLALDVYFPEYLVNWNLDFFDIGVVV
jgi:hypothetical protein